MPGHHVDENRGQSLVEYALLIALLIIVVILVLQILGVNLKELYCRAVTALGGSGSCSNYCVDGFESSTGWDAATFKGWAVQGGELCNVLSGEQQIANTCSRQESLPADYVINIGKATLAAGNGYGVYFRLKSFSPTNGYAFQYDPGYGGAFVVRKWVNGWEVNPPLAVAKMPGYTWLNTPRQVQLVVKGNTFLAYVDTQLVLTVVDGTYPSGGVGFRTWDSTRVCFDDFSISPIR